MKTRLYTETASGCPLPLGASLVEDGARFSIFSRHADSVTLVLFHNQEPDSPFEEIEFDPIINRTGDIWHIFVKGVMAGQHYGYNISGPYKPSQGLRFNYNKLLIDPYTRALSKNFIWDLTRARGFDPDAPDEDLSFSHENSAPFVPRCIVTPQYEREYDGQLNTPLNETIIYELHLKGFTFHESSGVTKPGTFAGLIEKIPYIKELGVTAVELMPIQEFDAYENININPLTGQRLTNYWGYSTIAFFAPKGFYASSVEPGSQVEEFRQMVKAFHDAGIEVILDIVFNHTGEGAHLGPTLSFKGIDNPIYYILEKDRRFYQNFSGCGNTFNCNHPLVREFILDALRYWVIEMHVDGFRFDLASILGRDSEGNILSNPPLIERIEEDPILRNTKIIAEAWDAAGAYQVGQFPGRWADWNGKYRDDVRRFWKGDKNSAGDFATRITGSSDLYMSHDRGPAQSINFITCHDGFTMNDLVSYKEKNNIANGEDNKDGENYNLSQNFGAEGPTDSIEINNKRLRMIKNFIATLFLSQGIPMFLAGDEFRRTQHGNNNTYCHDNEISWINWNFLKTHHEVQRFTRMMIELRKYHPCLRRETFFTGDIMENGHPDISWHGCQGDMPDWGPESSIVAMLINGLSEKNNGAAPDLFIVFNASIESKYFDIPQAPSQSPWKLVIDTSKPYPEDIYALDQCPRLMAPQYLVQAQSTVAFIA